MNYLHIESINRNHLFKSHPLADILRPHTLEIKFGTYKNTGTGIKLMHTMIQDYADDFETMVIKTHILNRLKHKIWNIPTC